MVKSGTNLTTTVGIDDMAIYIPGLYLPIEILAEKRNIEYAKLNMGLGLSQMAIPDVHEDAATMAANAVVELIEKNQIHPNSIGRIYLGTESALDGAKPTATYLLEMLRRKYRDTYGPDCLNHCDVVDLTFACVGGVDALHNTLDWVRLKHDRVGIVVTSDFAKYDLGSTGEYTQGAGAIAMLIKHHPRLLAIEDTFGVATMGVHDFFKPRRPVSKKQLIQEVLNLAGLSDQDAEQVYALLPDSIENTGVLDDPDHQLYFHKDTPVFDGPYSNWTYQNRIREAFLHFRDQLQETGELASKASLLDRWSRLIFHLPYAYHAKRIASEIFLIDAKIVNRWDTMASQLGLSEPQPENFESSKTYEKSLAGFFKQVSKSEPYRQFVREKLSNAHAASSQIGNMYACSIFLALMGTLESDWANQTDLQNHKLGFFGYGSGSKSKVFEATIQPQWREVVAGFNLQGKLSNRFELDYNTYEKLHRKSLEKSVLPLKGTFALKKIGTEGTRLGARYYEWVESAVTEVIR